MAAMTAKEFVRKHRAGKLSKGQKCCGCGRQIEEHPDEALTMPIPSKGTIKIVKAPAGDAPLSVRKSLIGLEFPTHSFEQRTTDAKGIATKKTARPGPMYLVLETKFMEVLATERPKSIRWYREYGIGRKDHYVAFRACEVKETSPVSPRL